MEDLLKWLARFSNGRLEESLPRQSRDLEPIALLLRRAQLTWNEERRSTSLEVAASTQQTAEHFDQELRLLEVVADGLLLLDGGARIKRVNRAMEQLLGLPAYRMIGRHVSEVLEGAEKLVEVLQTKEIIRDVPMEPVIAGCGSLPLSASGAVAIRPSGERSIVLLLRDLRETRELIKKAAEAEVLSRTHRQLQASHDRLQTAQAQLLHASKLAAVGELAAGVAHEINNPLAFVLANIRVLVASQLPRLKALARQADQGQEAELLALLDEVEEAATDSAVGTERIRKIVASLRTFSRIDQDHKEEMFIDEAIDEACVFVATEVRHRARLVKELRPTPKVLGNRGKLAQVFTNLIVNAVHAIPEGAPFKNVICVRTRADTGGVVVSVTDTGSGVPDALREKIFDPFFTTQPQGEGTGLGLSLSAEIVRQHGGQIAVESEIGVGTTFTVTFPRVAASERGSRPESQVPQTKPVGLPRVLIIDDEVMLLRSYRRTLGPSFELVCAESGREGIEILAGGGDFDLIVCDLMMPGLTGIDVYTHLKQRQPELLRRLAIATGGAVTPSSRRFLEESDVSRLAKPFTVDQLYALIEKTTIS